MPEESVVIRCESCNQKIWIPQQHLGDAGRCPKCKTPFEAVRAAEFSGGVGFKSRWKFRRIVSAACWAYLAGILLAAGILHGFSEDWALNSVLLFMPRWLLALPLLVLVAAALVAWRWAIPPLAIAAAAYLLLVAGYVVNVQRGDRQGSSRAVRIVTCNTGGGQLNPGRLKRYIEQSKPDIVVLQEWVEQFQKAVFDGLPGEPWSVVQSGGITVASRLPVTAQKGLPFGSFELSGAIGVFEVTAPSGRFRLAGIHLPTAREGIDAIIVWRLKGFPMMRANAESRLNASATTRRFLHSTDPLIAAGDFNLPPESSIIKAHWSDLTDAFRAAGAGFGHTKHTRWHGVRIDQIRFDDAWTCTFCEVGPYVGSDHRPVFAVLEPSTRSPPE